MSGDGQTRVGTAERERAAAALADHFAAGRLDSNEYEDRRGKAGDAVVRSDLDALFTDLPSGSAASGPVVPQPSKQTGPADLPPMNRDERRPLRHQGRGQRLGSPENRWRGLVTLSPFVALALFFITGHWQWFLLLPVSGIVYVTIVHDKD